MIERAPLVKLYLEEHKSAAEIAKIFLCSPNKINYWLGKHKIPKRTISEAIYTKHNPQGDPFIFTPPKTLRAAKLFGLGIGLYWGEGTKASKNSVRLGNTDPELLDAFIRFLITFFHIQREDLGFGLQIFSDIDPQFALDFWMKKLKIKRQQINKPIITFSGSPGTYRKKSIYGVLTVMYHNKRLRDLLVSMLPM